jgi:hypothetical protein
MSHSFYTRIDLIDCDQRGLILQNGVVLPWTEIEEIGKCEHLGRELTWSSYYLRERGSAKSVKVSALGGFKLMWNEAKAKREAT